MWQKQSHKVFANRWMRFAPYDAAALLRQYSHVAPTSFRKLRLPTTGSVFIHAGSRPAKMGSRDMESGSSDQQRYPVLLLDDKALLEKLFSFLSSSVARLADPYSDDGSYAA